MSTTLHRAGLADLDALAPLFDAYRVFYGQASDPALARAFLGERIANDESVLFLATDASGRGVGFTQLYPLFSSVRARRTWLLNDLFVATDARRGGVAQALIASATDFARHSGAARITLSTAHTNTAAQALYERLGWVRDHDFRDYAFTL